MTVGREQGAKSREQQRGRRKLVRKKLFGLSLSAMLFALSFLKLSICKLQ